jgi:two-component system, NarL family, nitrate/nitrite response regulator NarL
LKLLLVDDHALFRSGLRLLLRELPGEIEFFEAGNPIDALGFADKAIDLILLDLSMPGSQGMSALEQSRDVFVDVPIVVISSEDDPALIRQVIDLGASGFVPKSSTHRILIGALQLILAGGVYLPMHVLSQSARPAPALTASDSSDSDLPVHGMTERQYEVLLKAVRGQSNKAIARSLQLSEGTVKAHLSAAFRLLGVSNRTEAVYAAAQLGIRHRADS